MDPRLVYSVAEACAAAGIRRTTLYKAIRTGKLRAVKCGRRTLILVNDLHHWLEKMPPIAPKQRAAAQTPTDPFVIVRDRSEVISPPPTSPDASAAFSGPARDIESASLGNTQAGSASPRYRS